MNLDSLGKEVQRKKAERNSNLRDKYRLARSLGFSSDESRVLMFKSLAIIKSLSEERNGKTS